MVRTTAVLFALVLLPLTLLAQQGQNNNLAGAIINARQKNAAMLQNYNWNSRTELDKDGNMQDIRIELVTLGPGGQPQRQMLNDQPGQLPGGFFRKRIAEDQRKKAEKYVKELVPLVEQYTLPTPGAVFNFISSAQVQPITGPNGQSQLQITGNGVVSPGDNFSMTFNGANLQPISAQITTQYDGAPITITATFRTMQSGLNHLQYATVTAPDKNLTLNIHNYDYSSNN